jgi:hypothetical protein
MHQRFNHKIERTQKKIFISRHDMMTRQQKLVTILENFGPIVGYDDAINEVMSAGVQTNFAAPTN